MMSAGEAAGVRGDLLRACPPLGPVSEGKCKSCGYWVTTVPFGTPWARGRCINRECKLYGKGQTVRFANGCDKVSA